MAENAMHASVNADFRTSPSVLKVLSFGIKLPILLTLLHQWCDTNYGKNSHLVFLLNDRD